MPNSPLRHLPVEVRKYLQSKDAQLQDPQLQDDALAGDVQAGRRLMALSATKRGGLCIAFCAEEAGHGQSLAWLIAGLANDARMLCIESDVQALDRLKPALDTDLRVAFHSQDMGSFLEDIKSHHFDMMLVAIPVKDALVDRLQSMLSLGAILITDPKVNPKLVDMPLESASLMPLYLEAGQAETPIENQGLCLYVKGDRVLKRRGGRSANADRRSLRRL